MILKNCIRMAWGALPKRIRLYLAHVAISQADQKDQASIYAPRLWTFLVHLKRMGFAPTYIVDVGANVGSWSSEVKRIYPTARFVLLDADPSNAEKLREVCSQSRDWEYHVALLGAEQRDSAVFYQMGMRSSVLSEKSQLDRNTLIMPMTTLDSLVKARRGDSVLLKLDVQGYELAVLRGAGNLLSQAEVVILECSLIEANESAPLFADAVAFMDARGFAAYDICGHHRRPSDGALYQVDVAFAKKESLLRLPFRPWKASA